MDKRAQSISGLLRAKDWQGLADELATRLEKGAALRPEDRLIQAIALIRLEREDEAFPMLTVELLQAPNARGLLRLHAISPLVKDGKRELALGLIRQLMAAGVARADDTLLAVSLLVRAERWDEAIAILDALLQRSPDDGRVKVARIRVRLQAGRVDEAATLARGSVERAADDPALARVVMTALLKRGAPDDLQLGARIAAQLPVESEDSASLAVSAMYQAGHLEKAIEIGEKALASGHEGGLLHSNLAQAYAANRSMEGREKAVEHFRKASALLPDNFRITTFLAESLVRAGRTAEAIAPLKACLEKNPSLPHVHALCARAMKQQGDFVGAADQFQHLIALQPESSKWRRYAAAALIQAGRREEADVLFADYVAAREATLPESFEAGLEQLWDKLASVQIPAERLNWAWSLRDPVRYRDRAEWERRAKWGYLADHFLLDWLECRGDLADAAMGRLADLGPFDRFLRKLEVDKRGVIFASAHVGPMYAGPMALALLDIQARWLASTPSVARSGYAETLVSTSDQSESQVARACLQALREGVSLAVAVDGAINLAAPTTGFLGQQITYSSFCARLAYKLDAPTVFCAPAWKDGRIEFVLKRLVSPRQAEGMEDFVVRWRMDFLEALAAFVQGAPENLRLSGGMWRNIVRKASSPV